MPIKIYLSPSNQFGNQYAAGRTNEMEQCNKIAEKTQVALKRCGFDVKKAPKGQEMDVSIKESNDWGADLHLPIHTNAGGGNGTVVFVFKSDQKHHAKADPIYNCVQAITPGKVDYGVRAEKNLAELNSTNALAVYIEVDFHDNKKIAEWIIQNTECIAEAITKGVCTAYKVKYKAPQTNVYRIQVGAFLNEENAKNFLNRVKKAGFTNAFITQTINKED